MKNAFSRRFQSLVDQLTQGDKIQFAELTGKSASHVYKICRGASRPSMAYLQSLYDEFQVDLSWLLTGESSNSEQASSVGFKDLVHAPRFDVQASAGGGMSVGAENITDNFAFNKRWLSSQLRVSSDQVAFVEISGDSMHPTLEDGDMVLIDLSQQQVNAEGIFLLKHEGDLMAKRLKRSANNDLSVSSDNTDYPCWTLDASSLEENPVAGRVVWCGRKV